MQPEDIDKLFRERLAGHAPTPPAFVWAEIEAEIQPAKRRRPVMWLAAASVALLVLLGGTWWLLSGTGPTARPELAATAPARVPATGATSAAENNTAADQQRLLAATEKNRVAQATPEAAAPSGPSEATATVSAAGPAALVATTVRAAAARSGGVQPGAAADRRPPTTSVPVASGLPANEPAPVLALAATTPDLPDTKWVAQKRPGALPTPTVALTGPIEVDVRPAYEAPLPEQPARRRGLVAVLRQVRNVVQGEPVSLTAAGLPETVTVQARLAGRTLTKTIQL